jgi:hypothetical protein
MIRDAFLELHSLQSRNTSAKSRRLSRAHWDFRRREFVAGLGSVALAAPATWPLTARAQQQAMPVIGYLGAQSADIPKINAVSFLQGLKETGYVEGQNVGRSNTAGRKINMIGCRRSQPISSAAASP